jgi:CheY-like chemotaxis protein
MKGGSLARPPRPSAYPSTEAGQVQMPRVDGCGVLRYLAHLGNYVPVVAMSASPQALSAATVAGAQATLPKPFDLDRLLTVVRNNCHAAQNKA